MSSESALFNFVEYQKEKPNTYDVERIEYQRLEDTSRGLNYTMGNVVWNNTVLQGNVSTAQTDFGLSVLQLPITFQLECDGTKVKWDPAFDYSLCGSLKGAHHLIDSISLSINDVPLLTPQGLSNVLQNEKLKLMNHDEAKIYNDVMSFAFDTGKSAQWSNVVGEINNRVVAESLLKPANAGHIQRTLASNTNFTATNSSMLASCMGSAQYLSTLNSICMDGGIVSVTDTVITLQYMITIPFPKLHDVFTKLPSMTIGNGFKLQLVLNACRENSWQITYGAKPTDETTEQIQMPTGIVAMQVVGNTCPFLLSPLSMKGASGLKNVGTGVEGGTVSIKPSMGWKMNSSPTMTMHIANILMDTTNAGWIEGHADFTVRHTDHVYERIQNKTGGSIISQPLNSQMSRIRKLYIMGYRRFGDGSVTQMQSPLSPAPTTACPFRIRNLRVLVGGQATQPTDMTTVQEHYTEKVLPLVSRTNGNSLLSPEFSGMISKNDWAQGYTVYVHDFSRVALNESADMSNKQISVSFEIMGSATTSWDIYVFTEYQRIFKLERITGQLSN